MYIANMPVFAGGRQYQAGDKIKRLSEAEKRFLLAHHCVAEETEKPDGRRAAKTGAAASPEAEGGGEDGKTAGKGD